MLVSQIRGIYQKHNKIYALLHQRKLALAWGRDLILQRSAMGKIRTIGSGKRCDFFRPCAVKK